MNVQPALYAAGFIAASVLAWASSQPTASTTSDAASGNIPAVFGKFSSAVQVSVEGGNVVLRSKSVPDHPSTYFATSDSRYEKYNGTNTAFMQAPGTIAEQSYVFRIPMTPAHASVNSATPLGPIGIALNGVALFNQYNGQNRPLTVEIDTFDQWNGHPTPNNEYHYHVEPTYLTRANGANALVGFLLDGFPVYGPVENGKRVVNADLDQFHGHTGVTADYPAGIYHYHITDADPYINGSGFYGTAGTVSR
jgi:YHYH protein